MTRTAPQERVLGEIDAQIVGMQYHDAATKPGSPVNLEREPDNPHDENAIRVENGHFEPVGHLPRKLASWLAPLIDAGKLRVDAHVPETAEPSETTCPVVLTPFLTKRGQHLLKPTKIHSRLDALHEVVRRAYEDIQGYSDPDLIREFAEGLEPLTRQELLPETRLLLALMPAVAREARVTQAFGAMAQMRELLGQLTIGEPLHHGSLSVFPLSWPNPKSPPYSLLTPAIDSGRALVEEVNEDGDVPNLSVVNNGDLPILIPEGEILVGAKQNRVVNVTVLVAAHRRFTLPVSCVERGRWKYRSRHFRGEYAAPPSLRSKKIRGVQRSRNLSGEARSDQGEVWEDVDACLCSTGTASATDSLTDGFTAAKERLRECRERFELPESTAGILVARRGKVVGMDLFDCPETFGELKQRLLDAYLLDVLGDRRRARKAKPEQAQEFIGRIASAARPRIPALGLGEELDIAGDGTVGGALLFADRICHLAAFATTSE